MVCNKTSISVDKKALQNPIIELLSKLNIGDVHYLCVCSIRVFPYYEATTNCCIVENIGGREQWQIDQLSKFSPSNLWNIHYCIIL